MRRRDLRRTVTGVGTRKTDTQGEGPTLTYRENERSRSRRRATDDPPPPPGSPTAGEGVFREIASEAWLTTVEWPINTLYTYTYLHVLRSAGRTIWSALCTLESPRVEPGAVH
ncbi:unnamed protein product [Danaus chrysippus]|uniref:(African queen) hypothetical protein n=1 Tax=Danaus chrysippus TaxID=151541 RepID=A0A8J2RFW6_9NEOP|nr:unnamed protein product [Danaus chrysippus]